MIGFAVDASEPALQSAWFAPGVVVMVDVLQERLLGHRMRAALAHVGTRVKMAAPIQGRGRPIGVVCVDWMDRCDPACDECWARFEQVAADVLGPVMSTAQRLAGGAACRAPAAAQDDVQDDAHGPLDGLTPAERTVVRLAADGLSYKEIARRLDRSFSTVDHQLRSARHKLGVHSTARLVRLVAAAP